MKKHQDWATRLDKCLQQKRSTPFKWGENDCALFAADCVLAETGTDLGASWRGTYSNAEECLQAIKAAGFVTLEELVTAALGTPLVNPLKAQRGDVVIVPMNYSELGFDVSVGIVIGETVAVPTLPHGFAFIRASRIITAWSIPT